MRSRTIPRSRRRARAPSRTGTSSSSRAGRPTDARCPTSVGRPARAGGSTAVVATPGLTALAIPPRRAASCSTTRCAACPLVGRRDRPDRRRRLGRRHARDPARRRRCPTREVTLLEAERRKCEFLERWAAELPNLHVVWGRAEEQPLETFGVAVAKALAQPADRRRVVPAARPGGGRGRALGRARRPTSSASGARRGAPRRGGRATTRRAARAPQDRPDAAGLPAPHRRRAEAPAGADRRDPGVPREGSAVDEEARQARLEDAAGLFDAAAAELEQAAAHARRAGEHFRTGEVPRATPTPGRRSGTCGRRRTASSGRPGSTASAPPSETGNVRLRG